MTRRIVVVSIVVTVLAGTVVCAARRADAQSNVAQAWESPLYVQAVSASEMAKGQAAMVQAYAAIMQAQASMVKAQADAQVALANAQKVRMEAASAKLDNSLKYAKVYWDRRQARDTYMAFRTSPTPSPGESKNPPVKPASAQTVKRQRLTAAELDPVTNIIHWPALLQGERFAQYRTALDELFAARQPKDHGAGSAFYAKVRQNVDIMRSLLREQIRDVSPSEYVAAAKFLDGLRNEALYPPQINGVAMN